MNKTYLMRSESHQLEKISERFFQDSLPRNWTSEKPRNDYGVDLHVDLFAGKQATNLELIAQLKASAKPTTRTYEIARKTSTYKPTLGQTPSCNAS